jgi:hypothetical protein
LWLLGFLGPTSVLLTLWSLLARDTLRGDGKDGESLSNTFHYSATVLQTTTNRLVTDFVGIFGIFHLTILMRRARSCRSQPWKPL